MLEIFTLLPILIKCVSSLFILTHTYNKNTNKTSQMLKIQAQSYPNSSMQMKGNTHVKLTNNKSKARLKLLETESCIFHILKDEYTLYIYKYMSTQIGNKYQVIKL
jgi:hypothetical protein